METLAVINADALERLISKLDRLLDTREPAVEDELSDLVTHEQAAAILRISINTLYSMTYNKSIPFFKRGKRNFFSRRGLAEWIKTSPKGLHAA